MNISIWEQESFFERKDVIIIGSGLAGLWCAYELLIKHSSLKLLILDRGIIPEGASTRNAGFACFGSPTELLHDAKKMGETKMLEIAGMRYRGIHKIRRVLGDDAIGYDACGGYECLQSSRNNVEEIFENLDRLNKSLSPITGEQNTFSGASEKLAGLGFQGFDAMIENQSEGSLHSGKLVMALREKIHSRGGEIMQGIEVMGWEETDTDVHLRTKQNIRFKTTRLLICTNAFSNHLLPDVNVIPARGQIIVTNPIKDLPVRGTFHFDEGFYYFRNIGNRILLGGARNKAFAEEETFSPDISSLIQSTLEKCLKNHILPNQSYQIEYRWSGIMGFTEDKQSLIKQVSKKITAVIICNGMGVALSPIMAEQIEL